MTAGHRRRVGASRLFFALHCQKSASQWTKIAEIGVFAAARGKKLSESETRLQETPARGVAERRDYAGTGRSRPPKYRFPQFLSMMCLILGNGRADEARIPERPARPRGKAAVRAGAFGR